MVISNNFFYQCISSYQGTSPPAPQVGRRFVNIGAQNNKDFTVPYYRIKQYQKNTLTNILPPLPPAWGRASIFVYYIVIHGSSAHSYVHSLQVYFKMFEIKILSKVQVQVFYHIVLFKVIVSRWYVCPQGRTQGKLLPPPPPETTGTLQCLEICKCHAAMVSVLYMRDMCSLRI